MSDVEKSQKIKSFLKRFDKEQQIKSELLKHYEKVDLKGAILIDGHHVFINIIRRIDDLRRNPEGFLRNNFFPNEDPERLNNLVSSIKSSKLYHYDPRKVARVYGECVFRMVGFANEIFKAEILDDDRDFLPESKLRIPMDYSDKVVEAVDIQEYANLFLKQYPPDTHLVYKGEEERWIFDATMPEKNEIKSKLERNYEYWIQNDRDKASNIHTFLKLLNEDKWGFFENQVRGSIVVPFNLKNDVLSNLNDEEWAFGRFGLQTQERSISGWTGYVENREKGVDTKLVIKGCELAAAQDVDWVWILTADGDHAPLIDHFNESGKEVFLTSLSPASDALKSALVHPNRYLDFDMLFEYEDLAQELKRNNPSIRGKRQNKGIGIEFTILNYASEDKRNRALEAAGFPTPVDLL